MALFSQRAGLRPLSKVLQRESIDEDLRNALWTSFHDTFVKAYYLDTSNAGFPFYQYQPELNEWLRELWTKFYKAPTDTRPNFQKAIEHIRGQFFEAEWHWVFDFLEFGVKNCKTIGPLLAQHANLQLERENSAYRFVGSEIVEITDQNEIDSVEQALSGPKVVRLHLERATTLLSDRRAPDFRNSIKESISAVEATCRLIANSHSDRLGAAVKRISTKTPLHPAFEQALLKLYGFTSDEGGIRHSLMDEPSIGYSDAKFMLVLCSAFVNFLLAQCAEAGVKLK